MPSVLSILDVSVKSALDEAIAANSSNFHRTFDFVTQVFPWVAGDGHSHPWTDDAYGVSPGGFALTANGTIVTRADIDAGAEPPVGPYRFSATVRLTTEDGSARNPFFDIQVGTLGILAIAQSPAVTPDLAFTIPEVHGTPADLVAGGTSGLTGQGIIVGIIDFGFDFAHPNFLKKFDPATPNDPPRTRLLALWDQNDVATAPTSVDTALNQLKPSSGWAAGAIYSNSYIYAPEGQFLGWPLVPALKINDRLKLDDPYTGYYDPHAHYFAYPVDPNPDPASKVYPDNLGAHGTHVADIAVGNGVATGRPGVAPEADIIFVQLRSPASPGGPANRASVLDAVRFIARYAEMQVPKKRAVINICANTNIGSHASVDDLAVSVLDKYASGTSSADITQQVPIIVSAGNQFVLNQEPARFPAEPASNPLRKKYRESFAQKLELEANGSDTIIWVCRANDSTTNSLQIWYRTSGAAETMDVSVSTRIPRTAVVTQTAGDTAVPTPVPKDIIRNTGPVALPIPVKIGQIGVREGVLADGTPRSVQIDLYPGMFPANTGNVVFVVTLTSTVRRKVHAWVQRDGMSAPLQSAIAIRDADIEEGKLTKGCTLGSLSCGDNTIAVGAYFATDRSGKDAIIAEFSSGGPAVNYADLDSASPDTGSKQPHISAPGVIVAAARSKGGRLPGAGYSVVMSGTSMAAPHVTGTVALMLQKISGTTTNAVRTALRNTARRDLQWYDPKTPWHKRFGYGRLDVSAAVKALV